MYIPVVQIVGMKWVYELSNEQEAGQTLPKANTGTLDIFQLFFLQRVVFSFFYHA